MFQWLKGIFKKRKKNNCCEVEIKRVTCETCVWWKAEEENNAPPAEKFSKLFDKNYRMCDVYKEYTHKIHTCALYKEEKFEAQHDSIQTEEIDLNYEISVEESEKNDTRRER